MNVPQGLRIVSLATTLAVSACATAETSAPPAVTTLASYPNGTFLENLATLSDGSIVYTSYADRRLYRLSPAGEAMLFAELDVHPVAILPVDGGFVLTAHAASFFDGPAFVTSNRLVTLDAQGRMLRETAAPDARFLNGLVQFSPDLLLAADSIAGRIWAIRLSDGIVTPWLDDPLLAQGDPEPMRPGANGLKLRDGHLYISNSARGAIYRVRVGADRASGPLETYATTGPVDDFAFLADGRIVAATHGARLISVASDGSVSDVMASGCDGCTSVVVSSDGRSLTVLTTGNLLERGGEPARVLRVVAPE